MIGEDKSPPVATKSAPPSACLSRVTSIVNDCQVVRAAGQWSQGQMS